MASRIKREVPVTIGDVLDGHVKLDIQCLDRLHLHGYLGGCRSAASSCSS